MNYFFIFLYIPIYILKYLNQIKKYFSFKKNDLTEYVINLKGEVGRKTVYKRRQQRFFVMQNEAP